MNWVTFIMILIIIGSALAGLRHRLVNESRIVIYQVVSILSAVFSIWIGWIISHRAAHYVLNHPLNGMPAFIQQVIVAWHNNPSIGTWTLFIICYLVISGVIHPFLSQIAFLLPRLLPPVIGNSRLLGAALGIVLGAIRAVILGGILFVLLQFISLPNIAKEASLSSTYQYAANTIYKPWLNPIVTRELPVLSRGALEPIENNINMFAVPSGIPGQEQGMLIIPKQIATLSQELTKNAHTPREKAYALYEWEIHHISYDWHKYDDYVLHQRWDAQSPLQTLQTHKGVCADYALLYADLAHASGLNVKIIEGLGGTGGQVGSHAWNSVWDPSTGRWMLIDTTWGSEQDAWFDVSPSVFNQTHFTQTTIVIEGDHH